MPIHHNQPCACALYVAELPKVHDVPDSAAPSSTQLCNCSADSSLARFGNLCRIASAFSGCQFPMNTKGGTKPQQGDPNPACPVGPERPCQDGHRMVAYQLRSTQAAPEAWYTPPWSHLWVPKAGIDALAVGAALKNATHDRHIGAGSLTPLHFGLTLKRLLD